MNKDQQAQKEVLEQQLQLTKEQICILDEMDVKLHEMKRIAEYALEHTLSATEIERLNGELTALKSEISLLENNYNQFS